MLRMTGSAMLRHHNIRLGADSRHSTKATGVSKPHFLEGLVLINDAANKRSNLMPALLEYPNALVPFVRIRYNIFEEGSEMVSISGSVLFCWKFASCRLSRELRVSCWRRTIHLSYCNRAFVVTYHVVP